MFFLFNWFRRTPPKQAPLPQRSVEVPSGFKVVEPPKNAERREAMKEDDVMSSGGARTTHGQPVRS
jgi:hypothetical protein